MVIQNSYDGIDKDAVKLIRHKVRKLVGDYRYGYTEDDRPDLEQDLMIDLLQRMQYFDPSKAKKTTFIARIVDHCIATILEARSAQCRDWRLCQTSLNEFLDDGDGNYTERIEFLDSDSVYGNPAKEPRERFFNEIRMDFECTINPLPDELRDLYERLNNNSMSKISRDLGIHRTTLYGRRSKLQNELRKVGLEKYWEFPTHRAQIR